MTIDYLDEILLFKRVLMITLYFDLSTTEACGLYNYDADAAIMFYVFGGCFTHLIVVDAIAFGTVSGLMVSS